MRSNLVLCALMLLTLTNCSPYSQPDSSEQSSLASLVCDANCITPVPDNLTITANLGGGNQYPLPANLRDFNIAGDCNEGGYDANLITWELLYNGAVVRNSSMTGANTTCVNGRYAMYVKLIAIPSDNVDRTGSLINGVAQTHTLRGTIFGQDRVGGGLRPGANNTFTITLMPQ